MPALPLAGRVHRAMRDFVASSRGDRVPPTTVHVGSPEGEHLALPVAAWHDDGLRTDLLAGALACLDRTAFATALPWLTRAGGLETWEADVRWCAAAMAAYARFGSRPPGFFVVTRHGWRNVVTGETHAWDRVRPARYRDGH